MLKPVELTLTESSTIVLTRLPIIRATLSRFNVKIDIIKPDKNDPATNIHGLDYVDVPAGGKAGYQLRFRAHREGTTSMRVRTVDSNVWRSQCCISCQIEMVSH